MTKYFKTHKMLKFYFFVAVNCYVLRDQYLTNYMIGKKLGIHSNSKVWVENFVLFYDKSITLYVLETKNQPKISNDGYNDAGQNC